MATLTSSGANIAPSGDGQGQIVFSTDRDGNNEIYVMNADGSNPRRLTNSPADDLFPEWSPDGQRIALSRVVASNWDIWLMDMHGAMNRLTSDPALLEGTPSSHPERARLARAVIEAKLAKSNKRRRPAS